MSDLAAALLEALDDDALDRLAERLAPRLGDRLAGARDRDAGYLAPRPPPAISA